MRGFRKSRYRRGGALRGVSAVVLRRLGLRRRETETVSGCLNGRGFLVSPADTKIIGTSPEGTGLTLVVYRSAGRRQARSSEAGRRELTVVGTSVVDVRGNPKREPPTLEFGARDDPQMPREGRRLRRIHCVSPAAR